jgi:polysaccharide biosynthesis transport protein
VIFDRAVANSLITFNDFRPDMNAEQKQFNKILKFVSRNLRLILSCCLCACVAGLFWYLKSPMVYQATALIMYQQQQINPTRMSPDVQTRLPEMVNTVSQQVASRDNLEEIIRSHELYPGRRQRMPIEDVVEAMRRNIQIEPKRGADIFQVSFTGDEPRQVMRVANALASKFIEENIRFREQRVTGTLAYIKDELAIAQASLDKQEESMRDYKLRYYNELPEQRAANIARLNTLLTQDQNIQNNLQELKRTQLLIQEQISLRKDILARLLGGQTGDILDENPATELIRVRQELEVLRSRYTLNHPDVRRLESRLAVLLEAQAETKASRPRTDAGAIPLDNQLAQLELQLKGIDLSETKLKMDQERVRSQIEQVQQWVEATPVREAEWAAITRDYSQLQQHYQTLVARNLEAESAELLERRQKGSQFRIIESAHLPNKPFSPNFRKFMIYALALGLGAGFTLAYLLEFQDTSFKDVKDLENYLGLPVSCAIPVLQTGGEKKWLLLRNVAWTVVLSAGFAILSGGMLLLWHRGMIIL